MSTAQTWVYTVEAPGKTPGDYYEVSTDTFDRTEALAYLSRLQKHAKGPQIFRLHLETRTRIEVTP